jgi:OmpA-OmpF porin, OOP family
MKNHGPTNKSNFLELPTMLKRGLAFGVSLLALSATQSLAQSVMQGGGTPGPYVRLDGGWSHPVPMSSNSLATVSAGSIKRDEGFLLGGAGGYKFGPWRGELELEYMEHQAQSGNNLFAGATGASSSLRGSTSNLAAMINGYYDIATPWPITPYVGIGIGADYFRFSQVNTTANTQIANAFDTVFAYEAMAGVSYAINPQWSIGLEYRYFATLDPKVKYSPNPPLQRFTVNNASHNLLLGVAWHFAPPPAPPPAAAPAGAVPGPAAVVPAQQTFIVFFEFDKSSLTPDGRKVVDAAAAAFKSGKTGVAIAGYTDLAGTQQYNLALSKRRADAVKEALVRDGVPAAAISASWHGKENPRVPTADGVREPQNRRVEINM